MLLSHDFLAEWDDGSQSRFASTLVRTGAPQGEAGGYTAMAETVGTPCALAVSSWPGLHVHPVPFPAVQCAAPMNEKGGWWGHGVMLLCLVVSLSCRLIGAVYRLRPLTTPLCLCRQVEMMLAGKIAPSGVIRPVCVVVLLGGKGFPAAV